MQVFHTILAVLPEKNSFNSVDFLRNFGYYYYYYRPQTKLPKDNVFTSVCDSVHAVLKNNTGRERLIRTRLIRSST